jgi:hypothetical protein
MSKLDAQRAMREAKYARDSASGPTRREAAAAASGKPVEAVAKPAKPGKPATASRAKAAAGAPATDLCGHRSMNGRSCTRELGHDEKSHRYS